jgi:hypothetical protein
VEKQCKIKQKYKPKSNHDFFRAVEVNFQAQAYLSDVVVSACLISVCLSLSGVPNGKIFFPISSYKQKRLIQSLT